MFLTTNKIAISHITYIYILRILGRLLLFMQFVFIEFTVFRGGVGESFRIQIWYIRRDVSSTESKIRPEPEK